MDFKALRNRVRELEDEIYRLKRICEENTQSIEDNDGIGSVKKELSGMKSEIRVTAESVSSTVEKVEEAEKNVSEIKQTAEKISSTVTQYQKENGEYIKGLETRIEQTAGEISSVAKREFLSAVEVKEFDTSNTGSYKKDVVYFDTTVNVYYYYDDITERWSTSNKPRIESLFKQTSGGFEMSGNVKLSGDFIADGTVSADKIKSEELRINKLYSPNESGHFAKIYSGMGDFGVFNSTADEEDTPADENCIWGVYQMDAAGKALKHYSYGNLYLSTGGGVTNKGAYPEGMWDFGGCDVYGLDAIACFG